MVTQSFAFREPISELGQAGMFTGPNMNLPWKQGAFVLQSDGRLMGPGTPEKPQIKRRRNSPVSMQQDGREFRGTYNTTTSLTPGRLANGSLQSTLEPQDLSADNTINFGDFDPQSLEVENGGLHSTVTPSMDFSGAAGDSNGSAMAHSFSYPDSTGNMNLPTTPHLGAVASAGSSESTMAAQALTDLEALLALAGATGSHHHAYSGPEGHQHHHHNNNNNIQASPAPNVNTPASYILGAANSFSPSLFTGPNFRSAATNHHNNNNHHHHSHLNPPRFPNAPFLTPNSMEISEIGSTLRPASVACDMSIWGHHLSSQAPPVDQQQEDHHHQHASRDALIHASAQPLLPRNSGDSLIMHQTHAYNIHVNAVAATPEKNRDGRRLSYVAPPEQKSPSSHVAALHAFEATPPPQAPDSSPQTANLGTLHSHVYNISGMSALQQVEPITTTTQMPAAIVDSVVDSTVQEDPSLQEMFTQTYDPPMMTTAEMDSAQKEGYQFDLNEVPVGAMESTPNKRKKYHPRVAKDKRTYKPRKKLDNAAAPVTPDAISMGDHALGSNASTPAGSKRNHTTFMTNMTNGESFKDGMHSDVDVDMEPSARQHQLGMGILMPATPMSPDGTPNAVYNNDTIRYITEHTAKTEHLNTASLNTSFNDTALHDIAICDCEACIRIRLENPGSLRRISGKGSRTSQYINPTNAPQSPYEERTFSSPSHVQAWSENMFASGLHHRQQGPTSAALNNNTTETGTTELPLIHTPNSRSRRRNLFNQTIFTTASPEGHATSQNYASAVAAAGDSSPQNAANFLQPNHVQQELQQPIGGHPHHSYPRPVRRSLMGQFTLPPTPPPPQATPEESRPLSSNFCANSNFESEEGTTQSTGSRLENYSNTRSQAMVAHHQQQQQQEQQDPYTVVLSYFDQAHQDTTQGSSCLHQFNQAATERGFIRRLDSYNDGTEELTRMSDMVVQRREPPSLYQQLQSTTFHQAHHNPFSTTSALSALSYHHHHHGEQLQGAIVPASGRLNWNPDLIPYTLHPRRMTSSSSSFMSRLCPRGILSPQRTPFRMMTKIQRIVYLKTILMSHHLDTSPTQLLHHVQEHLPSHEKDAFELLWPLILEPVSREELQRLVEIAEADTTATMTTNSISSGLELTEYVHPVEKRKQRGRKPGSKNKGQQQNNMAKAMTLWPDLIEQGHHPKPGKQKGDKSGDRQERQNSNGRDTQGLELVPYEGKAVVPYDGPFLPLRKRKPRPKVVLDTETVRVWKLLMGKPGPMDSSTEADANKELKWEEERRLMKTQADIFIKRMHLVQGDRSFSRWKGSVVDSVVGAFLTQNVNDVLSSSAFMCMRSRFPGRGFKGPLQSKAPEEALGQPLETEARNSSPAPLAERMGEPQGSSGHQEDSSSGVATSHIVSVESRPPSLESEESHNEESLYPAHLEVRHEETMSWPDQEGEQRQLGALELHQLLQQQISISTELSQTAENTNSLNASDSNSAGSFPVTNSSTEQTTAEESTGANIIDTQLDLLSLAQQGTNEVRDLAMENDVGSELVTSNMNNNPQLQHPQQQVPKGPKVFNSKSGLTGPERARQEEKQVTARKTFDWEHRREEFKPRGPGEEPNAVPPRTELTEDGVDWEAVRHADVEEVANVIKERGLNWILAGRIKAFLERLQVEHGALDLEWLRSIPTDDTKEYLLSIRGLGLKSVECIRLLTLHHLAFPVDTNVGRICVRLGWVPLEPLPEELQLHLLELYPVQATIQKYLWPRLCTLDQQTLYELHYQMITFGKVFCTKSKPNCNACPMKADCKHFASALSSAKLALPASERPNNGPTLALTPGTASSNGDIGESQGQGQGPSQIGDEDRPRNMPVSQYCQPIVEEPMTPESSEADAEDCDIEDYPFSVEEVEEDSNMNLYIEETSTGQIEQQVEIPNCCSTSDLSVTISESEPVQEMIMEDWGGLAMPSQTSHSQLNSEQDSSPNTAIKIVESGVDPESPSVTQSTAVLIPDAPSQELVLVNPENAHIPVPKLKNIGRLRTVHYVYELPDNHPLVEGMDAREADDPCTYLLAIWSPGEVPESIPNINDRDNSEENPYASSSFEGEAENIKATLLVPCRTAMQGSFPLNGTYFQVNEVFADHASSLQPILVPRTLLWNLRRRFVFFGTSVTSIFRGMTVEEIQACFWRGYVCVRGFDRTTRAPKPLVGRLHLQASKTSGKGAPMEN